MERTDERYRRYVAILEEELVAAMGCTEPIAIALAARAGARTAGRGTCPRAGGGQRKHHQEREERGGAPYGRPEGDRGRGGGGHRGGGAPSAGSEVIADVSPEEIAGIAAYAEARPSRLSAPHRSLDFDIVVQVFSDAEARGAADAEA